MISLTNQLKKQNQIQNKKFVNESIMLIIYQFDQTDTLSLLIFKHNYVEWFSIKCCKTKTKLITLANCNGHRQSRELIKIQSNNKFVTNLKH